MNKKHPPGWSNHEREGAKVREPLQAGLGRGRRRRFEQFAGLSDKNHGRNRTQTDQKKKKSFRFRASGQSSWRTKESDESAIEDRG